MATDARVVWMPGGLRTEVHLSGGDTSDAFCLLVDHPPVGWSLPPHRHQNEAETIHIVEGDFEMEIDGTRSRLSAGATVHIPRGVVHSGVNVGQQTGRRILIFSPAGMENFFLEAGASTASEDVDADQTRSVAVRHGWEFVADPHGDNLE